MSEFGSASRGPNQLSISVVIPTYGRSNLVERVAGAYLAESAVSEVVVVDDGSTDATPEACLRLAARDSRVRVLRTPNGGAAAARAAGAVMATSAVLMFADDDVLAGPDLVRGHLEYHRRLGPTAVVSGYVPVALPSRRRRWSFPLWIYQSDYENTCARYEKPGGDVLMDLCGSNFSVRKELFVRSAPVAPDLPYHEDQVLGFNLRELGGEGVFVRSLRSSHLYERSPDQFWGDAFRQGRALAKLRSSAALGRVRLPRDDVPNGLRLFVRLLARNEARSGRWLVRQLVAAFGFAQCWRQQEQVARLYRHIERQRGFEAETMTTD